MYNDYPTIYETTIDQNLIYFILLGVVLFIIFLISLISVAKVLKKANRSFITGLIPIYNIVVLLEIVNLSKWYLLFLLIPVVNLFFYFSIMLALAKSFRKSKMFGVGLFFLPFIFFPILAWGSSEYMGINLSAMNNQNMVTAIPKMEVEEKVVEVHDKKDEELKNIDISIGGGVYQKDYTNNLLQVDTDQVISDSSTDTVTKESEVNLTNFSFITPVVEENNMIEEAKEAPKNENAFTFPEPVQEVKVIASNSTNEALASVNSEESSDYISCPKCGAKIKKDSQTCFLCGTSL